MISFVQLGLGPLGQKMIRFALERGDVRLVAAIDPDPAKVGQDVGTLCGLKPLGIRVEAVLPTFTGRNRPRVAVVSTVSSLQRLLPQVSAAAKAGLHVVSTCEELSYPWLTQPALARKLDRVCRKHGIACVGTGINPGFLMDYLPSVLSGVCQRVNRVRVMRVQDASSRRVPFQQKIGAGLTPRQFRAKVRTGTLRHVGLTESVHMLAAALGWNLDRTTESLAPVLASKRITNGYTPIDKGMAAGVEQVGRGYIGRVAVIELHFRAAVGEPEPHDTIQIDGEPNIVSTVPGGVNGDVATCAITLNALHSILRAQAGLNTMLDLPTPSCRRGNDVAPASKRP
jgi:4-hydroxy-tetrahydrodipicolinate reductase